MDAEDFQLRFFWRNFSSLIPARISTVHLRRVGILAPKAVFGEHLRIMIQQSDIRFRLCILLIIFTAFPGCLTNRKRGKWFPPQPVDHKLLEWFGEDNASGFPPYEHAYAMAREFEKEKRVACVDYYFQAATLAWPHVVTRSTTHQDCGARATKVYHSSLEKVISTGQEFCRFNPAKGILIQTANGEMHVPVIYSGFPWEGNEYDRLLPVGNYESNELKKQFRRCGLGVAVVGIDLDPEKLGSRKGRRVSSATVVLHPIQGANATHAIQIIDSLRVSHVDMGFKHVELNRDLSAPFGYVLSEEGRNYIESFLRPSARTEDIGLFMLEPYQAGKIPVVFIHGLLSDPVTWVNLVNEFRANPDLVNKYQIWAFEYSTGEPFLASAAKFRRELCRLQKHVDPQEQDGALSQTMLIGHSMGGLIAKLQVSHSGDLLWNSVANKSFHEVLMTGKAQRQLAEAFFFEPTPSVSRVVFAGTPHKGSPWAKRSIGACASRLVDEPNDDQQEHKELIDSNPGVFSREFTKRIPTSVDLLREDSQLLRAIDNLPIPDHVQQHSIIGNYSKMICRGDSDTIVPVSSAKHPGVESEKMVQLKHTLIHKEKDGIEEIFRILRLHYAESMGPSTFVPSQSHPPNRNELSPINDGFGSGYDF